MADTSTFPQPLVDGAISSHAGSADAVARKGFGPRVRRLHARIGAALPATPTSPAALAWLERGLVVRDPEVLERRALIQAVMCRFRVAFDRRRFAPEWQEFAVLEADGLVRHSLEGSQAVVEVTASGSRLI